MARAEIPHAQRLLKARLKKGICDESQHFFRCHSGSDDPLQG